LLSAERGEVMEISRRLNREASKYGAEVIDAYQTPVSLPRHCIGLTGCAVPVTGKQ
jgi:hypothetical protein